MSSGRLGGDLGLTFDTAMSKNFLGSDHALGMKNTINLAVMKSEGKAMDFKGLDTELRYTHGDGHCGAFFKFSSFADGVDGK